MPQQTVLILGKFDPTDRLHKATVDAIHHAAETGELVANTRWMGPDDVDLYPGLVAESSAVVLAPQPKCSTTALSTAFLEALRLVREHRLPFLATGSSHALVFVEAARNLLGLKEAGGVCFSTESPNPIIHDIPRSDVSEPEAGGLRTLHLKIEDHPLVASIYGEAREIREDTDALFGLSPDYAITMEEAGFVPAIREVSGGRPYLYVFSEQPFHVTAAYLPQVASEPGSPHPLFGGLLAAAASG